MRVHIGTDHAGFDTKNAVSQFLVGEGYEVIDHGADVYDAEDDYPTYIIPTALAVVADPGSLGIVLGGSGNGEVIAANKVRGVRAALVHSIDTAMLARQHNDANIAALGARQHSTEQVIDLVISFLTTDYSRDERHDRRLEQISTYEESLSI
ncbi:MAG: ribose-5-phosphate isomerase [Propionibacteriaceae bacterium]|jgi:ribose 5-phosphate isomerase B|nr:ribose-5-phosphate isomerase [Propionibacteriaceae bacterium]